MTVHRRKVLHSSGFVRGYALALRRARDDLEAFQHRHVAALAELHRQLDAARSELDELRAVCLARARAQDELVGLHREIAIVRARAAERDPAGPLH